MSKQQPKFVLRHRENGRIFGYTEILAREPLLEKVRFEDAFPEKCMPEHIEKKVAAKKTTAKKTKTKKEEPKNKKPLDLSTPDDEIDNDPDEILGAEDDLTSEIDAALSADASAGLK